ncbi:MAG: aminotransferase class V-fold PLP-dependent enzyme [Gammaproteobacteria bacterium]|nr:aminotransferase class V-fold PLP-dependent enzyme [Gammaproteobacteria bacterium]MDP2141927.1 aminotransferase class V-fold PLP-dependent enzyme [Gammaproteobacteria bacterium]MDP2347191.1 aminotransferase class V-fold PLP-dependent enzyme [Gammaproteobacteria bacterium]
MTLDIARIREHTPATSELIHFNNAGAALSPTPVQEALLQHLGLEQRIGGYEAATHAHPQIENFYSAFARLFNCDTDEVAWAENATHGWNTLLHAIPFKSGDRILTGQSEYGSNYLAFLHLCRLRNVHIEVIPNDANGRICLDRLTAAIDNNVRLIALTHVPSQSGVIHPATEIGQIARTHDILYLLDACQSAGQLPLDVNALGCDMLTGTGRKYLRGPRGTGFMYVRKEIIGTLTPAWIDLHSASWAAENTYQLRDDARRFENWESFVAGKIALGVAVDYAMEIGMEAIAKRVGYLASCLREQLSMVNSISVHESGEHLSGIVTFSKKDETPQELQHRLQSAGINISTSKLRSNVLDFGRRGLGDINRASVHYYNTEEEVERFCQVITAT